MLPRFAIPSIVLTVAGFVLFLLVTLSPPYIPNIFLVGVRAGSGTDIHFGVYGECYSYSASWTGNPKTPIARCDHLGLGYSAYFTSTGRPGPDTSSNRPVIISRNLSKGLAMNPVVVFFAGLSVVYVVLGYLKPASRLPKVSVGVLFITSLFAWTAFALDLALALVARDRLRHLLGVRGYIGNGPWLALGGAIALTLSMVVAGFGAFRQQAAVGPPIDQSEKAEAA